MHAMLLSTAYNSLITVLANLHHSFKEVAQKSYQYIKSLPPGKQPAGQLIISTSYSFIAADAIKVTNIVLTIQELSTTLSDSLAFLCANLGVSKRRKYCPLCALLAKHRRDGESPMVLLVILLLPCIGEHNAAANHFHDALAQRTDCLGFIYIDLISALLHASTLPRF